MFPDEYSVLCGCCTAAAGPTARGQLRDGAVLRPLSQFPGEVETLLPPLCMLQVVREGGEVGIADTEGTNQRGEGVRFKEIYVCGRALSEAGAPDGRELVETAKGA
jgi:hypothetical protein